MKYYLFPTDYQFEPLEFNTLSELENEQFEFEDKIKKLERFMVSDDFNSLCDLQKIFFNSTI